MEKVRTAGARCILVCCYCSLCCCCCFFGLALAIQTTPPQHQQPPPSSSSPSSSSPHQLPHNPKHPQPKPQPRPQPRRPNPHNHQQQHQGPLCRSRSRLFQPSFFELHSCAWCFHYLARVPHVRALPRRPFLLVLSNVTSLPAGTVLVPNVSSAEDVSKVCGLTSPGACERWKECCLDARECCRQQVEAWKGAGTRAGADPPNRTCPRTWDGWGCWEDAAAGSEEYVRCPGFLQFAVLSGYGKKTCQANGTWYSRYQPGSNGSEGKWVEWTDYTKCIDKQRLVTSVYLALGCNACSILFLVPALLIFLVYRALRRQHRIRLHVNLFSALLLSNVASMLWDVIVTHDRLTTDSSDTLPVLLANGVGCKLLAFLRLYLKSTTYVWMFCEGLYLHRLITNAFRPPKSLLVLYLAGWGFPLCYCVVYVIIRAIYANDSCWAKSFGHLEWIIYCPNMLCLIVNLFFLCNILRVLLTQLQTHPNEPSNFRRALKATFVLIPLFGGQLFVTVYRLPAGQPGGVQYEQFTVFVNNSQGFFVALIFCFFNGEVIAQMKRTCTRFNLLRPGGGGGSELTSRGTTLATSLHQRDEDSEYPTTGGGGVNGSLMMAHHHHHNGSARGGRGLSSGSKKPSRNGSSSSSHSESGRKYSYIPMKTMSANG